MVEDNRLNVFLAVAEQGSFTMAARQLGITQPAVSQHIAELERQLSTVLFERGGKVALTEQGRVFLDYARRIRRDWDAVNALFGTARTLEDSLPVRIAATSFVAAYLLSPVLERLERISGRRFIIETYPEAAFAGEGPAADVKVFTVLPEAGGGEALTTLSAPSGLRVGVRLVASGLFADSALCALLQRSITTGW